MFQSLANETCDDDSDFHLWVEQKFKEKHVIETDLSQVPLSNLLGWEESFCIVVEELHFFTTRNWAEIDRVEVE